MKRNYSEVFRRLSNEAYELAKRICERTKPVFPAYTYNTTRTVDIYRTATEYFGTRDEVCINCNNLLDILKEIVELKDICLETQVEYCLFIKDMLDCGKLCTDRYRIRYDDFEPVRNNDYEKITTDMNELFKLDLRASEETKQQYLALFGNIVYLRRKNKDNILTDYLNCMVWNIKRSHDKEVVRNMIDSNYIIYSVWLKDYQGDKQLHNQFFKSDQKIY